MRIYLHTTDGVMDDVSINPTDNEQIDMVAECDDRSMWFPVHHDKLEDIPAPTLIVICEHVKKYIESCENTQKLVEKQI